MKPPVATAPAAGSTRKKDSSSSSEESDSEDEQPTKAPAPSELIVGSQQNCKPSAEFKLMMKIFLFSLNNRT